MCKIKLPLQLISLVACFLISFASVSSQESVYEIVEEDGVEVYITGGSTLHDWTVTSAEVTGYPVSISFSPEATTAIDDFAFAVSVASMKGGRGPTMDKKIYDALNSESHPAITYQQSVPAALEMGPEDGSFTLVSEGNLSIAGVTKQISVDVKGTFEQGLLTFEGHKAMLLSDYEIEPPSAMFGQIKTKNEITVHCRFTYKLKN